MTNISDCPNLLLSAMDDLNLFEVCWSLAGPEQRAKYSYTYSIHIQPLLISSYVPWSCRTLSCHIPYHAITGGRVMGNSFADFYM